MTSNQIIIQSISQVPENQLIFASRFYSERLEEQVTESAFYQTLGRQCKAGELCRIAKGTYYRPKKTRFGVIPPSEKEIVSAFTEAESGTVVGYSLYNSLNLTTQVSKRIEVYSSKIEQQTKSIGTVSLRYCNLVYTEEVKRMVQLLDVLQHFDEIQDLNYSQVLNYFRDCAQWYNDEVFRMVVAVVPCQKRTISFLRSILTYYSVPNTLGSYLSSLSSYKHPTMEELYETAYLPQ